MAIEDLPDGVIVAGCQPGDDDFVGIPLPHAHNAIREGVSRRAWQNGERHYIYSLVTGALDHWIDGGPVIRPPTRRRISAGLTPTARVPQQEGQLHPAMTHPNEDRLRDLYATFAQRDLAGFLAGCNDDVTFTVPGQTPGSGVFTKATFVDWIAGMIGSTGGTFQEHILDLFANDDHGVLLLHHEFDRDAQHREYRTAHIVELREGRIASWTEHPGSLREFEDAWGRVPATR